MTTPSRLTPHEVQAEIAAVCADLASFLQEKNRNYGNSAVDPVRILSKADPVEQIKVRMDDKLSRLIAGGSSADEAPLDTLKDLVGYWVLWQVAERLSLRARALHVPPDGLG